jgi:hypothetical protein
MPGSWRDRLAADAPPMARPFVVTMVEQLVASHALDVRDPWNFLLLMGSAVEQGTLEATGGLR